MMSSRLVPALVAGFMLAGTLGAAPAPAATSGPVRVDHATVELVAERGTVFPGDALRVGLRIRHDPGWHTYWINPGDSGLATRIEWRLPPGVTAGEIEWPAPRRFDLGGVVNFGYDGDLLLPVEIRTDGSLVPGDRLELAAKASWLICEEICIPGDAELALSLAVAAPDVTPEPAPEAVRDAFAAALASMPRRDPAVTARFAERGAHLDLVITGLPGAPDPRAIEVFPVDPQILASAATPAAPLDQGAVGLKVPKSDYFVGLPERFGLVVVHEAGRARTAWAVDAIRGEVPPLPERGAASAAADGSGTVRIGLVAAILFALAGGVILNLMPCVFPVLALKAMALLHSAHDRRLARRHGLLYLAGVVASFLALGGLLVALRAGGEALGWGFQLQLPWVVGGLALLMFAMGLSLSGVYQIGGRFMNLGAELAGGEGDRASFFTGVLAVLVASPCTAPFMGPALGFAATQPAVLALAVFAALGIGLALPIVLVSFAPRLARLLPRPGPWMETFKQAMAFPLYLTAVWLLWVLGRQVGVDGVAAVLAGAAVMALGLWLIGRFPTRAARVAGAAAVALALLGLAWAADRDGLDGAVASRSEGIHEPWTPARLAELRAAGRPVLVNMTAAWCITCLANERVALASERFRAELDRHGVTYLKGDWTHRDPEITAYLARYGVPLYVVYPRGTGDGETLPQLLTPDLVSQALARAAAGTGSPPTDSPRN
jgi:thiol:disulfide interchange protein DsbD